MFAAILTIVFGYLIGSVSPAYILGKVLKKVDIREVGSKNAGTTNTYKVLGLWPAVVTGIYDLGKGLLSMYAAFIFTGSEPIMYLAGLAAIVGHIFPFYLNFQGGQGVGTATGLLFYSLYSLFKEHFIPVEGFVILLITVLAIIIITRQKGYLALIVMPSLAFMIFKNYSFTYLSIFTGILILFIFSVNVYEAYKNKLFELKPETLKKILPWRTVLRPLAVIFPIMYMYLDKNIMLWILGVIGGIFLIIDLTRLLSHRINIFMLSKIKSMFKKREEKRFSSMTLFFLSAFFTILLFSKGIAITAIMFLIFGDVFAKFFGSEFGRIKIWDKTLEGSLAFFSVSLLVGYLIYPYVGLSPAVIISGAIVGTFAELMPLGINDNFIVSLSSAATMLIVSTYL